MLYSCTCRGLNCTYLELGVLVGLNGGHNGGEGVLGGLREVRVAEDISDLGPHLGDSLGGGVSRGHGSTLGTGPAELGNPAGSHLKESSGLLARLVAQVGDDGSNELRLEGVEHLLGHDGGGHTRASEGSDGVHPDVLAGTLASQGVGESNDTELGSGVVGLAVVSVDTSGRGNVDNASIALGTHGLPSGLAESVGALEVDGVDEVPVLLGHLDEGLVTEDTSVVDDDVHALVGVESSLDDLISELDGVVVGDGLSSGLLDLLNDQVSGAGGGSLTRVGSSEVVHDDLGTAGGQQQSVSLALYVCYIFSQFVC